MNFSSTDNTDNSKKISTEGKSNPQIKILIYLLITLIVFFSSFKAPFGENEALDYSIPSILSLTQQISIYLLIIFTAITVLLWVFLIKKWKRRKSLVLIYYLIFHLIIVFTEYYISQEFYQFLIRTSYNILLFLFFYYVLGSLKFYDYHKNSILKSFFWGIFLFLLLNILMYIFNIGTIVWKGRLFGLSSHPNFIGMSGTFLSVISLLLFLKETSKFYKPIFISGIFIGLGICILSGSRTSYIGVLVGFLYIFNIIFNNFQYKIFLILFFLLFALIIFTQFDISSLDQSGRGNTRADSWRELYEGVSDLPLFGKGRVGATANSYMFSIVAAGLFGSFFLFLTIFKSLRIFLLKKSIQKNYNRVVIGTLLITILVTALLEGYLLESASISVYTFWMVLSQIE